MADSDYAYRPPGGNAYGPKYAFGPDDDRPSAAAVVADTMPQRVRRAKNDNLTPDENQRLHSAMKAMTSAQENLNEANGVSGRFTSPDDAANYPAY